MPTLNWIGKEKVINHHLDVPFRTLVPSYSFGDEESAKDNLIIHGDNLEALKALLPQYEGKVKLIYIDPPYNTGNEGWVYNDNVNDPKIKKWLGEVVGKEGEDLSRHDKWLCMMYPRLKLLHKLLSDDGAIFISIDDVEIANLRLIVDEIFGTINFISEMICEGAFKNDARQIGVNHEYVLIYAKNRRLIPKEWSIRKEGIDPIFSEVKRLRAKYQDDFDSASQDLAGWFRASKATPSFAHRRFRYIDARGAYKEDDPTAPGGRKYTLINPINGKIIPLRANRGWAFDQETFNLMVKENRVSFISETSIMVRRYLHETDTVTPQSVFYQPTRSASEHLAKILGTDIFEYPKDYSVVQMFLEMASDPDSIILDSFAGSGTTAHAVLKLNQEDGGNRKFIMIEMEDYAESITAERVRRVIQGYGPEGKEVPGTGGGFSYLTLGPTVFTAEGALNPEVDDNALRQYIWYAETKTALPSKKLKNKYHLGSALGVSYYFFYVKGEETVLDFDFLKTIKEQDEQYVIYADSCSIDSEYLKSRNITFKKIPRDIPRY